MMAALASATMPTAVMAGVRASEQINSTDTAYGIDHAVVQDSAGALYDVFASDTEQGRRRLAGRVRAARVLSQNRDLAGLGFDVDRVVAFSDGDSERSVTADTSVLVAAHHSGEARPLELLTLDDCAAVGTTLGAIHRLRTDFLQQAKYPAYATGQIRAQLIAWIRNLREAGHVPQEITDSWANVLETDGLWSFVTCPVHGGLSDGDLLFSGSSITAVTNWQNMQVNDPARDLAWIFAKLDESHRNALISAYGRLLGNRLDDLIMLRANLWLQMEQVGDFITALQQADNVKIMKFKAQVERLAHQLSLTTTRNRASSQPRHAAANPVASQPPSTITVGTLLDESERRRREAAQQRDSPDATGERRIDAVDMDDTTGDFDVTGGHSVVGVNAVASTDNVRTTRNLAEDATEAFNRPTPVERPVQEPQSDSAGFAPASYPVQVTHSRSATTEQLDDDDTDEHDVTPVSTFLPKHSARELHDSMPASSTIVISKLESTNKNADASAKTIPAEHSEASTMFLPLLERDEAAMQKAREQLGQANTVSAEGTDTASVASPTGDQASQAQ